VLGEYPGDPGPPGMDVAGTVAKGPGSDLACFGFGYAPLACMAIADRSQLGLLPSRLSFEQASTLPVTWCTTNTALQRARLGAGSGAIVQAAAGGVGLKAVEYCHWLSAKVAGTAGRPNKHALICMSGVQTLCSSRDSGAFAVGITHLLPERRASMVLNSLSLDFISVSFASLREGGAVEEIGKRSVWASERQVRQPASIPQPLGCRLALHATCASLANPYVIGSTLSYAGCFCPDDLVLCNCTRFG